MAQQDADASEVHEAEEVLGVMFMACDEATVVLKPRKEALDLPAVPVAAKGSTVLGRGTLSTASMWRDHLDPTFPPQPFVGPVLCQKSADSKRERFRRSRGGHGRGLWPISGVRTGVRCGR